MPDVLKVCCIEAFEKLHAHGILHGDAELRHMLINADAKVTIVDFKAAATCVPLENVGMEEVGLRNATPEEFRLEMRRVKFKLDYDGAREKEREKLVRKKRGELRKEDLLDPPVEIHVLSFQWLEGCERPPIRFVVPGQTKEQVELAVKGFLKKIREKERQVGKKTPAARGRKSASTAKEVTDVPEVPVAPPRPKLKIKLPPLNAPISLIRGIPGSAPLLPPLEIHRSAGSTESPPLAVVEASLQPGPSTESLTEDEAVTHPYESELAFLTPGFGFSSLATTIKAHPVTAISELGNHSGNIHPFTAPSFDFAVGKWPDGESAKSSSSEDRKDVSQGAALQATSATPSSTSCSSGSTFPIMRTFADVARKAIQVFGRIAGQKPVQLADHPPQQQKASGSSRRKRRLSESSASESSEYEASLRRKRLRRSTHSSLPSGPPFSSQPPSTPIPRTWSLITMGQSRKAIKRKRESEEPSELVWNMEQELRKKRCKLSELSDLSDASGSETEGDTTRDRMARVGKILVEGVTEDFAPLLDTLSSPNRATILQSDKKAPPIIIRDYAYMSHKASKAPYVPHPPTENRMAAERAKHICLSNAKACLDAGLQYPMVENQQGRLVPNLVSSPYIFSAETFQEKQERKRREKSGVKGGEKVQRSFGSLRRKLNDQRGGTSAGFEDRLLASWKDVGHRLREKVTSKVRFSMENLLGEAESACGGDDSSVLRKVVRRVKEKSGILKRLPPVKAFDYQVPWEDEDEDLLSPKVGPEPERWDRSGGFGMLGVRVKDTTTKTEEAFRHECALRVYKSQMMIENVDAEWREEGERMEEIRRREVENRVIGL